VHEDKGGAAKEDPLEKRGGNKGKKKAEDCKATDPANPLRWRRGKNKKERGSDKITRPAAAWHQFYRQETGGGGKENAEKHSKIKKGYELDHMIAFKKRKSNNLDGKQGADGALGWVGKRKKGDRRKEAVEGKNRIPARSRKLRELGMEECAWKCQTTAPSKTEKEYRGREWGCRRGGKRAGSMCKRKAC